MGIAIKHPLPDRVKPSFVIFLTSGHSDTQGWASECPDIKNYKWWLNPVWQRMLYSYTHMVTVGVKGLTEFQTVGPGTWGLQQHCMIASCCVNVRHWSGTVVRVTSNSGSHGFPAVATPAGCQWEGVAQGGVGACAGVEIHRGATSWQRGRQARHGSVHDACRLQGTTPAWVGRCWILPCSSRCKVCQIHSPVD